MATTTVTVEQRSVIPSRPEFGSVSLRAEEALTPPAVGEVDIDSPLVLVSLLSIPAGHFKHVSMILSVVLAGIRQGVTKFKQVANPHCRPSI